MRQSTNKLINKIELIHKTAETLAMCFSNMLIHIILGRLEKNINHSTDITNGALYFIQQIST